MDSISTIVDRIVIPHESFANAERQLDQLFLYSLEKSDAEGIAVVGESGTGKTTLLKRFKSKHKPTRKEDGIGMPLLCASVPSMPTVRNLAAAMLETFDAQDCDRGTEYERTRRLRVLLKNTGTRMVMIEEFQHFYDRGTHKIMHHVADWLKVLIDEACLTLVVSGLPSCRIVINQNEQLARRFLAPIQLPRFDWRNIQQREQFIGILAAFHKEFSKVYKVPVFHSQQMAFRFYCASGGLLGYFANVLRQAERNAAFDRKNTILIDDLNKAHIESVWSKEDISCLPKPFEASFTPVENEAMLECVGKIGIVAEHLPEISRRSTKGMKRTSINSRLVA